MKLISWNVQGLRSCLKKGFEDVLYSLDPDIICIQETKMSSGSITYIPKVYHAYWNFPMIEHKGFGGVAIFSKLPAIAVYPGIGTPEDVRGRSLTVEYESFFLVTVYTPVMCRESMSDYKQTRLRWEDDLLVYITCLKKTKPVIVCGDFNASVLDIDVPDAKKQKNSVGFHDWERQALRNIQNIGFIDSFRYFHPIKTDAYTWWWNNERRRLNIGLRLDYFMVDDRMKTDIVSSGILSDIMGSDHCPIALEIKR